MEGENDDDDDHNKCSLSSNSWAFACGEKRRDVDGAGKECDVYDVAFNDEVVEVAKKAMFEPLGVLANDIESGGRTASTDEREAKVRDSLAKMCVEIVSRKYYSREGKTLWIKVYVTETRVRWNQATTANAREDILACVFEAIAATTTTTTTTDR